MMDEGSNNKLGGNFPFLSIALTQRLALSFSNSAELVVPFAIRPSVFYWSAQNISYPVSGVCQHRSACIFMEAKIMYKYSYFVFPSYRFLIKALTAKPILTKECISSLQRSMRQFKIWLQDSLQCWVLLHFLLHLRWPLVKFSSS